MSYFPFFRPTSLWTCLWKLMPLPLNHICAPSLLLHVLHICGPFIAMWTTRRVFICIVIQGVRRRQMTSSSFCHYLISHSRLQALLRAFFHHSAWHWPISGAVHVITTACSGEMCSFEYFMIGPLTSSITFSTEIWRISYTFMPAYKRFYDVVQAKSPFLFFRVHCFIINACPNSIRDISSVN